MGLHPPSRPPSQSAVLYTRHRDTGLGKRTLFLGKDFLHCLSPTGLERGILYVGEPSGTAGLWFAQYRA